MRLMSLREYKKEAPFWEMKIPKRSVFYIFLEKACALQVIYTYKILPLHSHRFYLLIHTFLK